VTGRRRAFAPDGVASFTCDCAIGRKAGSSREDDSAPYAKMLAWFAAGAVRSRYFRNTAY